MSRGGKREGAGRPKGSYSAAGKAKRMIWARPKNISLAEFARLVINDPEQPTDIREHMTLVAAPWFERDTGGGGSRSGPTVSGAPVHSHLRS